MSEKGKVYIIGAGCGSYDLITLRGMKLLKACNTVVYDSLIDERLLDFVDENAEKIYVGKRCGHHSTEQEEINRIIVQKALEGKTVARLKGGDPFVFGRVNEEIHALGEYDIEYQYVPGISSAIAAPEFAGIPVTLRGISRSFHVITGHTAKDLAPDNLAKYACMSGTLIVLMGLKNIRQITQGLIAGGMNPNIPAAVISHAGTAAQSEIREHLDTIADAAEREKAESPAVIVIGHTVRRDYAPHTPKPLKGVSVTVTGTRSLTGKLEDKLTELGAYVNKLDFLRIVEYNENSSFDSVLENISEYGWVVLTSANGAEIFFKRLHRLKIDFRRLSAVKFAVIGSETGEVLKQHGIYPELIPEKYTSEALGNALVKAAAADERVLILRARKGSLELTDALDKSNVPYTEIKTYDAVASDSHNKSPRICTDYLTFASSSGVETFFNGDYELSPDTKIVCIGDVTAQALKKRNITDYLISKTQTAQGIIDTILKEKF